MPQPRVYAGRSAAHRVEVRRRALLDAGLELLGTRGWSGTTVRGVCTEAGLTARFFYESFAGLDELTVAVFDEIAADATLAVTTAVAAAGPDRGERAFAAIDAGVRALTDDPRRARVVFVEAVSSEPLMRRRMRTMTALSDVIAGYGREDYAPAAGEEPLLRVTAGLLAGGIVELLIAWTGGALDVTREQLVADCADLFVGVGDAAREIAARRGRG